MKLALMQPYFFPYIGYFQLMASVDRWIVFDEAQFIQQGWINRNRILHPDPQKEWQYITIPLQGRSQFDRICDIRVHPDIDWRGQILGKLTHYKKSAPYYQRTIALVEDCFDTDETKLSRMVVAVLNKIKTLIQINTPISVQSEIALQLEEIHHPGHWALRIAEALQADEYVNPMSGESLYKPEEFAEAGIKLSFLEAGVQPYPQNRHSFSPGLSILDILMFNDLDSIAAMVGAGKILTPYALSNSVKGAPNG